MPQAVAAAAVFISSNVGEAAFVITGNLALAGTVADVAYVAAEVAIYAAISVGVAALTAPKVPDPASLQTPLKQSMPVRQSAFGRVRVAGSYALYTAGTGGSKTVSYDVLALLDGQSARVVNYYLNDDLMAQNAGGYWYAPGAFGKYGQGDGAGNLVQIGSQLGVTPETDYLISAGVPLWDSYHRGDGVTSMLVICKQAHKEDQASCFPNGVPTPSAVIDAQLIYDPRDGGQTQGTASTYTFSDNPANCLLAYLTDASGGMGLDYSRFIEPTVDFWTAVADECDGGVSVSGMHATLLDAAAAGDNKIFLADTTGLTAGVVIQLPTESVTVSGLGLAGEVDITGTLAFSHQAGELAYWDAPGETARYRCAGTYRHDNAPGDVIKSVLSTFDGWMGQRGDGALVLRTNTLYEPTVVLTDRHVVGFQVQHFLPDEQATNQFIVSYTDPASAFNKAEAGYVQDDVDIASRGQLRSSELSLDWVPSGPQAISVARALLGRSTQPLRGLATCNLAGLAVMGERYVRLQISELPALNDIVVEVTGKVQIDLSAMTVSFPWVAAGSAATDAVAGCHIIGNSPTPIQSITLPAPVSPGSTLVALCISYTTVPSTGSGWTAVGAVSHTPTVLDPAVAMVWQEFPAGGSAVQTPFTSGVTNWVLAVWELRGLPSGFISALHSTTFSSPLFGATSVDVSDASPAPGLYLFLGAAVPGGSFDPGAGTIGFPDWTEVDSGVHGIGYSGRAASISYLSPPGGAVEQSLTYGAPHAVSGILIGLSTTGAISNSPAGSGYTQPPLGPPSGGVLAPLDAPIISSVTPDYIDSGGGVSGARLSIEVDDPGLDNLAWKARWKLSADTIWASAGDNLTAAGSPLTLITGLVAAAGAVDVQVAYSTANQTSPWSATSTVTVAAPLAVASGTATATETIAAGAVCNLYSSSGAKLRNANATDDTKPANCFVKAGYSSTQAATIYFAGQIITGLSSLTPGATYYLDVSAGAITATQPSTSGNLIQIVGQALTATTLLFAPEILSEA